MRNDEIGLGDDRVADEQHVDVERSRTPMLDAHPAGIGFEVVRDVEQLARCQLGVDGDDRVEEATLIGSADRIGLVDVAG